MIHFNYNLAESAIDPILLSFLSYLVTTVFIALLPTIVVTALLSTIVDTAHLPTMVVTALLSKNFRRRAFTHNVCYRTQVRNLACFLHDVFFVFVCCCKCQNKSELSAVAQCSEQEYNRIEEYQRRTKRTLARTWVESGHSAYRVLTVFICIPRLEHVEFFSIIYYIINN